MQFICLRRIADHATFCRGVRRGVFLRLIYHLEQSLVMICGFEKYSKHIKVMVEKSDLEEIWDAWCYIVAENIISYTS